MGLNFQKVKKLFKRERNNPGQQQQNSKPPSTSEQQDNGNLLQSESTNSQFNQDPTPESGGLDDTIRDTQSSTRHEPGSETARNEDLSPQAIAQRARARRSERKSPISGLQVFNFL